MEENKVDIKSCSNCRLRYDRVSGELNCGIKESKWTKGRMCLAEDKILGQYWIHEGDIRKNREWKPTNGREEK